MSRIQQNQVSAASAAVPASVNLKIEMRPAASLRPYDKNARTHSVQQIKVIARSIQKFGFINPILIDATGRIIAGHGRLRACSRLGIKEVPTIGIEHLSEAEVRAYIIADNRTAELAGWDRS